MQCHPTRNSLPYVDMHTIYSRAQYNSVQNGQWRLTGLVVSALSHFVLRKLNNLAVFRPKRSLIGVETEKLIEQFHDFNDQLIAEVDKYQQECIESIENNMSHTNSQ